MEDNSVDLSQINQPIDDEWIIETSSNDNIEQNVIENLNDVTINDNPTSNINTEIQENDYEQANSENSQNAWNYHFDSNNHSNYTSGYQNDNKSNDNQHYHEKSWENNSTSNNYRNEEGYVRGGSRRGGYGRGFNNRYSEENNSFNSEYNTNHNNYVDSFAAGQGYRGRGRGHFQSRGGGKFRGKSSDDWYGNNENGHNKRKENEKFTGPKTVYIPPDIENEEFIAGIEAGSNFEKYEMIEVKVSGIDPPTRIKSFQDSGLLDILLENLSTCNFSVPTPIQNYAIPVIINGRDLMASAQTGSGKTAAYVLPILHNLLQNSSNLIFDGNHCEPHVIIMAPTRELVIQISECVWKFSKGTNIRNGLLYGGTSVGHQKSKLLLGGIHILTATPGRLNDFVERGIITFSSVKFFVLDEADRMLDMGFKPVIERVLMHSTMTSIDLRQTLMFSATFASEIQHMATSYLKPDYIFVAVGEIGGACKDVLQTVVEVSKFKKKEALHSFLKDIKDCQGTIVFVEHKRVADYIAAYLSELDFPTTSIHGDREQPEREQALKDFKKKKMKILVATAVASRGLDIEGVNNVVNYDLPKTIDEYVHRIGRTGRLGNAGKAISFFDPETDNKIASELVRILKQAEQEVPSWLNNVAMDVKTTSIDDFNDIRENFEVTSPRVSNEEEW